MIEAPYGAFGLFETYRKLKQFFAIGAGGVKACYFLRRCAYRRIMEINIEVKDWITIIAVIAGPILAVQAQKLIESVKEKRP